MVVRKFSGEKFPRTRSIEGADSGLVSAGAVTDAELTMDTGFLLGRTTADAGAIEQIAVAGPTVTLAGGYFTVAADALTTETLAQFAGTTADEFGSVVPTTGTGYVVRSALPTLISFKLQGATSFGVVNHITIESDGVSDATVTIPSANGDTLIGKATVDVLTNKTLTNPVFTGAPVLRQDQNAATIFEVRNDNTNSGSYSILRLTNGASTVDMLATHYGTVAQFAAGGSIVQFNLVFNTFVWYSIAVAELMRLSTTGLNVSVPATMGAINYAADAQASDTYVITLAPAPTAYTTGMPIYFKANTANTGAASLNVNSLGAKTIVKAVSTTLADNDILAGMICHVVYDGTNFVLLNPRTL